MGRKIKNIQTGDKINGGKDKARYQDQVSTDMCSEWVKMSNGIFCIM